MRITTEERGKRYAIFADGEIVTSGVLQSGDYMATALPIVTAEDENEYVGALAEHVAELPELPSTGWLEEGAVYAWNDTAVMVRQSHWRTIYPPDETLNLFVTYREDADNLEWIPAEKVAVGLSLRRPLHCGRWYRQAKSRSLGCSRLGRMMCTT